jgi:hypothetical protein
MHLRSPQGKLLGYNNTECSIDANLDKISAITEMGHVRNVKDVQWLMGCLTTPKGAPLVQAIEKVRPFLLNGRDTECARRAQSAHHQASDSGLTQAR